MGGNEILHHAKMVGSQPNEVLMPKVPFRKIESCNLEEPYSGRNKKMKTGNQEKAHRSMNFAASLHGDHNVKEERFSLPDDDVVSLSPCGQFDVSDDCHFGSVAKVLEDTFALGKKFRNSLSPVYPSLSSSCVTSVPHSSLGGENMLCDPSVGPKKQSPVLQNQLNSLTMSQGVMDMEIDYLASDVQAMDNYKSLTESSIDDRHECADRTGGDDSVAYGKAPDCMPVVLIDSDDEEEKDIHECCYRIGGDNSMPYGKTPDCMPLPVVVIDSSDDEDNDLVNTSRASTSGLEACNVEEYLGSQKQSAMDVVLSQTSISPDTQDFCSQHRYEGLRNDDIDSSITIPPMKISVEEDTCLANDEVITQPSRDLPVRAYEKMETKETPDCMPMPVIIIDSGDDEDNDLVNTSRGSTSGLEACNVEEYLRSQKQSAMDVMLSQTSISPDTQYFCSQHRYDGLRNDDIDSSIATPPMKISVEEDTCLDNDKFITQPSRDLPVRAYEKMETKETPDCMPMPVIIIDSGDDEDNDLVNTSRGSTSGLEACNVEEYLRSQKQSAMDVMLSQTSISPDTQYFCSQHRYDGLRNDDIDSSIATPPMKISVEEDTCLDNDKFITQPSRDLPVRAYEKMETKETPDCMPMPVIIIDSGDDEDNDLVNTSRGSTSGLEACNVEEYLRSQKQSAMDVMLSQTSISPDTQYFCSQHRYDGLRNDDIDSSIATPPMKISVEEDTCLDNDKFITQPSRDLPVRAYEKMETKETPDCMPMPVMIIDSGDDEDSDLVNTSHASTSGLEACNVEEYLGSQKQSAMDVVLSQTSISPDTQYFCSQHRYDGLRNDDIDSSIATPPMKISVEEDTCLDNDKFITQPSRDLPVRAYEEMETKESNWQTSNHCLKDVFTRTSEGKSVQESTSGESAENEGKLEKGETHEDDGEPVMELRHGEPGENTRVGSYVGLGTECLSMESYHEDVMEKDSLTDIWREMAMALEYSKDAASDSSVVQHTFLQECEHSCFLKEDLGYVCRICGVIQKSIETIFDYQWIKGTRSTRTYVSESRNTNHTDPTEVTDFSGNRESEHSLSTDEISIHPTHRKQMKAHQLEGFNFLIRNLVADKPGGCILAHAPGSGKTFMIISFIQSFLAKYPYARPLVVLPKGIIPTWKKEFQRWQVEDITLYDFYTSKAENRYQQLDVLKNWIEQKSVLFLGYKQFSNIICGSANSKTDAACQERLLKVPGLLILDEGHTPRNDNTFVFQSLRKVQTPRKVVLSGTLFQNHVSEVFNILDLVRPKFLKLDSSRSVVTRVLSRVPISRSGRQFRTSTSSYTAFYDAVEETLQNGDDLKRKVTVIHDLREMTNGVLHYYRGDFLEELPGLVDFTVLLNLSSKQKDSMQTLKKLEKFKRSAVESVIYMHPLLKEISENATRDRGNIFDEDKIDRLLDKMDVEDGVKTKFFLNILSLSESSGEKLLVFSVYLLPLKFLERLLVKAKGWSPGKEIFLISGDSSTEQREWSMEQFNNSSDSKVFFGSIKACGEGISLVGASRVLILDVHLNPSVTRQAIGRAFRPGQHNKVYTYRLVAADSPEEENHYSSFRKELISKMWFEWSEFCNHRDYEMDAIDVKSCEDTFFESPVLGQDVKVVYRR